MENQFRFIEDTAPTSSTLLAQDTQNDEEENPQQSQQQHGGASQKPATKTSESRSNVKKDSSQVSSGSGSFEEENIDNDDVPTEKEQGLYKISNTSPFHDLLLDFDHTVQVGIVEKLRPRTR